VKFRMDGARAYALLVLLCIAYYVPGLATLPPIDRDEARFSQASRQMVESGDFIRIRFQDEPRHKKPIGIYWLQAASASLFTDSEPDRIWPYRLPSFLGATLAVLFTFAFGKRLFGADRALLGAAIVSASLILNVEAHQATTDAMLLASIVAAQGALGLIYTRSRSGENPGVLPALLFWTAQGIGILLKGPVISMISVLTVIALVAADRDARWLRNLRPIPGLFIVALLVCPWAVAVSKATGGAFFQDAVKNDLLPKLFSGQESHGFPPGYYLLLALLTFWPGSAYAAPGLISAWKERSSPAVRFALAWIVPVWIAFELIPTKLPHYIMPVYPALALLTAGTILSSREFLSRKGYRWPVALAAAVWTVAGIGTAVGVVALPWAVDGRFVPLTAVLSAVALVTMAFALRSTFRRRAAESIAIAIAGGAIVLAPMWHTVLPGLDSLWVSRSIATAVELRTGGKQGRAAGISVAASGYEEPSLVFLLGTDTRLTPPEKAAIFLQERPDGLALIDESNSPRFLSMAAEIGVFPHLIGTVRGFQYTKGRRVAVRIYARAAAP